jgi:hypothetical protein
MKHNSSPFLKRNKDICIKIKEYVCEHLGKLSSEMLCEYLHNTVLPMLVEEENGVKKDSEGYVDQVKKLLGKYGLTKICPSIC